MADSDISDARLAVYLLKSLLSLDGESLKKAKAPLQLIFSVGACRDFMLVHENGGVEWFNKERFEELALWLAVVTMVSRTGQYPSPRTLAAAEKNLLQSFELAAQAGYRTRLFLHLLEPEAKKTTAIKQIAVKKSKGAQAGSVKSPAIKPGRKPSSKKG